MKRIDDAGPAKGDTKEEKSAQSVNRCDISPLSDGAHPKTNKVVEEPPIEFDAIRNQCSLMRYSDEHVEEEFEGPHGRTRRTRSRRALLIPNLDWKASAILVAVAGVLLLFGLLAKF